MILEISWRQDYEILKIFEIGSKRSKLDKPIWHPFDLSDIIFRSRDYCKHLFNSSIPVLIREGANYVANTQELYEKCVNAGRSVKLLSDCTPSNDSIEKVGFWQN